MNRRLLLLGVLGACASTPGTNTDPDHVALPTGKVVASLQRTPYDSGQHLDTCKVFHHVFAPDGRLLTKGAGGEYPHHRGLFLGWNQMRCRGKPYDFWHCRTGESQQFRDFVEPAAVGLDPGWQVAAIDWIAEDGTVLVEEQRATRAVELDATTTALEVAIVLRAGNAPVLLEGDPQHSGHQFRALQQFAVPDADPVRYLRPAGATGRPNDIWVGCDWIAALLPMPGGPVTVLRIEGPQNPKPALWSTRAYGRFGATYRCELTAKNPLRLHYRYVVSLGERDAAWCAQTAATAF